MSDEQEKSNTKIIMIGAVAVVAIGFGIWAKRNYQEPVRITPKEGRLMAEKLGDAQMQSATVAPIPGADTNVAVADAPPAMNRSPHTARATKLEPPRDGPRGWLTGRVILDGKPPAEKPLPLDPECRAAVPEGATPMTRHFVVGTNGGLADVVVTLVNPPMTEDLDPGSDSVGVDIRGCQFHPYVKVVRAGGALEFRNRDEEFHDIVGYPTNVPNSLIRYSLLPGAPGSAIQFNTDEDFIKIYSPKREWMMGYVTVLSHEFYGVTDTNGHFRIPLPMGLVSHVKAHHPLLPPETQFVALSGTTNNASVEIVLQYQPPKEAAK